MRDVEALAPTFRVLDPSPGMYVEGHVPGLQQAVEALETAQSPWLQPLHHPGPGHLLGDGRRTPFAIREERHVEASRQQIRPLVGDPSLSHIVSVDGWSDQQDPHRFTLSRHGHRSQYRDDM